MKPVYLLLCTLILATLCSCKKEVKPTLTVVPIGDFGLLLNSRNYIPYYGNQGARFVDSLGNDSEFLISSSSGAYSKRFIPKYDVFETGDTVHYSYSSTSDQVWLRNQAKGLEFRLDLHPQPLFSGEVADVLDILVNDPAEPGKMFQVFHVTVDQRTYPAILDDNTYYSSITFHNMAFASVLKTNFTNPNMELYFKSQLGIVAFRDYSGTLWRFKEMF